MKKRAALLVVLVVLLLVVFWMVSTPDGPMAEPVQTAAGDTDAARVAGDAVAIGPAIFPHDEHVEDFEVECVECHHETNAAPLNFPHKDYFDDFWIDCKICHNQSSVTAMGPRGCSECHHSRNGDIADETLSAKVVIHKNCWACHDVGTGADASATCADCHEE